MSVVEPIEVADRFRPTRSPLLWLCEREIVRYLKIWQYTIAGHAMSALLFVIVFGLALNGHIQGLDGTPYARFILPGLLIQAVVTVGFINGTTTLYEARHDRYINDVLASPLRWWEFNLALVVGSVTREILTGGAVLAIALPLTGGGIASPAVALGGLTAVLIASAQAGVIVGNYCKSVDQIYSIEMLVVIPLGFLGGTFYAVSKLPAFWGTLTHFNPIFYFIEVMRAGLLGRADISSLAALGASALIALLLTAWSLLVFRSGAQLKP